MIKAGSRLTITRVSLSCIQVTEYQVRDLSVMTHYLSLLLAHPDDDAGVLMLKHSDTHPGMFELLDGHRRFCASLLAGRRDALCMIIVEGNEHERSA